MERKVALVTGAGRGIGQGICVELAQKGWAIVVNDICPVEDQEQTKELILAPVSYTHLRAHET